MLLIEKETTPNEIVRDIIQVKQGVDWDHIDITDTSAVRSAFDTLNKQMIRSHLIHEQKGLCAYCMRRIHDDESTTIEHWYPINKDGRKALDYENMMACCDGGRTSQGTRKILCCDAAKGNQEIKISPYDPTQMDKIQYDKDGIIRIHPEDEQLTKDINEVLKLNGEMDDQGNFRYDTSTRLVYGRKQAYQKYSNYIMQLIKHKKPLAQAIRKKTTEIKEAPEREEFAGVLLFFLNRKLKSLRQNA